MLLPDAFVWIIDLLPGAWSQSADLLKLLLKLLLTATGAYVLYVLFFRVLRLAFRKLERDIALVTLNVSAYPALVVFVLVCLEVSLQDFAQGQVASSLSTFLLVNIILAAGFWAYQLITQVVIYYLKEYSTTTEVMWDSVLIPLLEGVIPVVITIISLASILQFCFGIDLSGIWLTLGGAGVILGFATKDILANFFSGIALLIDSPFQFGDVVRLEDAAGNFNSLGIVKKIGLRVTQIYMFESHTEVYVPNSVLQAQLIRNLSRPLEPTYYSTAIELHPNGNLEQAVSTMRGVLQAHPDTLGNVDVKLERLEQLYQWEENGFAESFTEKKQRSRVRLRLEQQVNQRLDEVEHLLEALVLTIRFAESGGLNTEEFENIRLEFQTILDLFGFQVEELDLTPRQRFRVPFLSMASLPTRFTLTETLDKNSLLVMVRDWYRAWLQDPDLVDADQYVLPEIWERKIFLLRRRVTRLYTTLRYPHRQETRLDDSVEELQRWLKNRFKQARSEWQEPRVSLDKIIHNENKTLVQYRLNYYVDDIRLEDGERGIRVNSDIHREILFHLQDTFVAGPTTVPYYVAPNLVKDNDGNYD